MPVDKDRAQGSARNVFGIAKEAFGKATWADGKVRNAAGAAKDAARGNYPKDQPDRRALQGDEDFLLLAGTAASGSPGSGLASEIRTGIPSSAERSDGAALSPAFRWKSNETSSVPATRFPPSRLKNRAEITTAVAKGLIDKAHAARETRFAKDAAEPHEGSHPGRDMPTTRRNRILTHLDHSARPSSCSGNSPKDAAPGPIRHARDWVPILAHYREPYPRQSAWELFITVAPLLGLWAMAWWSAGFSYPLAASIAVLNAAFLVRLFMIQHDCGHAAYFRNRMLSDWTGRLIGVVTLTPYDVWRRMHAAHHASTGNLERRGMGDVATLTVAEFRSLSHLGRLRYRLYRNPLVLFGLGPFYLFFLQNRLPVGLMRSGQLYWISAMGTNAAIAAIIVGIGYLGGADVIALVFLPTMLVAASTGVWLFYIQHQFEETSWDHEADWQLHDAALHGSSHYVLPGILRWFSANIGMHHVHHLQSRVPFYRLPEILRDHPELAEAKRLTLRESFACVGKSLWDEKSRRLISFRDARAGGTV